MEPLSEFLSSPIGLICAFALALLAGSMIFNVRQWEAHWKQWAIDTSKAMSKAGLIHTPKVLDALAVGDLAGAFKEIKSLADIFKDPKQLAAEFQTVFQNMLDAAFKDPTQAKALQALANDAVAAFASGDPAKSAAQLAADAQAIFASNPMFATLAQNGLQLPALLSGSPLTALVSQLSSAGLTHLIPVAAAGLQSLQPAAAPPTPTAAAQSASVTLPPAHSAMVTNNATAA